ncbi:MAG TPA: glutamate 5-kinase [Cyanobacteria bacterium UBA11991]|nr:glutamate 5-kinase [Cyanobacteriota bacterium]MDY6359455.1 glutamate 5-kinase [Cyanobacteriota bacterium]MDY6363545.1 glutamate 5-kinase [Cyanobacteriota bacterium]MDY6382528.1 glutamate 5-kinase [Cyanobacteriota bacterium]HCB11350.1 glutamate 5-kinase [Cyanobacteria bacterium UBA11991]
MKRTEFIKAKRIVVKFGTNVLRNDDGYISLPRVYTFIEDIARLVKSGKEVIVVTSGAVSLGKKRLGLEDTSGTALKQACAAIGQGKLMSIYENGFDAYGLTAAQILLTEDDFSIRQKYLSIRTTFNKLLELGVIPIINQNDTVSTLDVALRYVKEDMQVCFSDNDKLSALVASELDAGLLIILSDIDGLYDDNPKTNPDAKLIKSVKKVDDNIMALASGASDGGRGGMATKLQAAKLVTRFGGKVLIANGKIPYVIKRIFDGEDLGTMFLPSDKNLSDKKRWIGYATNITGKIVVNDGAKKALISQDKSLLPIGVVKIKNTFGKGDVVSILDEQGCEFARGIVNYNSDSCKKILGSHSDNIADILGFKNYDAIITRDNITIL